MIRRINKPVTSKSGIVTYVSACRYYFKGLGYDLSLKFQFFFFAFFMSRIVNMGFDYASTKFKSEKKVKSKIQGLKFFVL